MANPHPFATVNHICLALGIPYVSRLHGELVLFLPIDIEANLEGRTARVEIPGILKSKAGPKINEFNGGPLHIALAPPSGSFEFTYAALGPGTSSVTSPLEMSF